MRWKHLVVRNFRWQFDEKRRLVEMAAVYARHDQSSRKVAEVGGDGFVITATNVFLVQLCW